MRILMLFIMILLSAPLSWGYPSYVAPLSHRSLIYFAPTKDAHVTQFILETLINECELEDRDLVTLVITADGFTSPKWMKHQFDSQALFSAYKVERNRHTVILIGKDGGEKRRWGKETDWQRVKHAIDGMPMRQREMAKRLSPCSA